MDKDQDQYEEAKKQIKLYEENLYNPFIKEMTCICCKSNVVSPLEGYGSINPLNLEKGIWNNGAVEKISYGFGSKKDLETYFIAICDDCIEKLHQEGIVINYRELSNKLDSIIFT